MKILYDGPMSNFGLSLLRLYRQFIPGPSGRDRLKERLGPQTVKGPYTMHST